MEGNVPLTGLATDAELARYFRPRPVPLTFTRTRRTQDDMKDMLAQFMTDNKGYNLSRPSHESVPEELRVPALDNDKGHFNPEVQIILDQVDEPIWAAMEAEGDPEVVEDVRQARAEAADRTFAQYKLDHNGEEPPVIGENGRFKRKATSQAISYAPRPAKRQQKGKGKVTRDAEESDVEATESDNLETPEEELLATSDKTTTTAKPSRKKAVLKKSAGKKRATEDTEMSNGVEAAVKFEDKKTAKAKGKSSKTQTATAEEPTTTESNETGSDRPVATNKKASRKAPRKKPSTKASTVTELELSEIITAPKNTAVSESQTSRQRNFANQNVATIAGEPENPDTINSAAPTTKASTKRKHTASKVTEESKNVETKAPAAATKPSLKLKGPKKVTEPDAESTPRSTIAEEAEAQEASNAVETVAAPAMKTSSKGNRAASKAMNGVIDGETDAPTAVKKPVRKPKKVAEPKPEQADLPVSGPIPRPRLILHAGPRPGKRSTEEEA